MAQGSDWLSRSTCSPGSQDKRIYKQGSRRQTGEAYGDNLGNWAVTRHRGITVPEKPRLRELWQLIGQDIFTNDSSLSGPGLSQAAGHPESRGKSTANPTSSVFLEWGRGQRTRSLSTPINPLPKSLEQTSPHTFTREWRQCAICLLCTIQMAIGEEPELSRTNLTTDVFELRARCLCCSQKGLWRNATISSACEQPGTHNIYPLLPQQWPLTNRILPSMYIPMDPSQERQPQSETRAIWVI